MSGFAPAARRLRDQAAERARHTWTIQLGRAVERGRRLGHVAPGAAAQQRELEQQELVDDLALIMNGNPRERVLRDAAASAGAA